MNGKQQGAHYLIFEPGMGYFFFHARFFQTTFLQWLFCFALKFTDFSDNIDQQEFFRPFGLFGLGLLDLGPEFFSGVRTPALNNYASRRPSCLLESVGRLYQSSFICYTSPKSHYTHRKLGPKAPQWLRKSHGKSKL